MQGGRTRSLGLVKPYFWACLQRCFWKRLTLQRSESSTDGEGDWLLDVWGGHPSIFCLRQQSPLLLRASALGWHWGHQLSELASSRGKYSSVCWISVLHSWLCVDFSAILASASFYSLYPCGYHYTSILFSYNLLLITYIMYFNHIQLYSTPSLLLPSKMSILCMYIKEAYIQEVYKYNPKRLWVHEGDKSRWFAHIHPNWSTFLENAK